MTDPLSFLTEVALRSSVVLATAFLLLFAMKRASASERHFVLLLGLFVVALVPLGLLVSPKFSWTLSLPQPAAGSTTQVVTTYLLQGIKSSLPGDLPSAPATQASLLEFLTVPNALVALIVGGMLVQVVLLGRAAWSWRKICCHATKASLPREALERAQLFAGARNVPAIFASSQVAVPLLAGWLRTTIILPVEADRWPADRLVMVLCHELAHARRGDPLLLPLICALRILYWWHPLVWLALVRLLRKRENACDDLVLNQDFRASDYADLIVTTARQARTLRWQSGAMAMASPSHLGQRIRAILNPTINRRSASRRTQFVGLIVASALGWFFVAAQVQAEDKSPGTAAASKTIIKLEFKLIGINESTYQDHRKEITAAVENSDLPALVAFVHKVPGASVLFAPTLLLNENQKGVVEVSQTMSYPTAFEKDTKGTLTPSNFKTRDLGLSIGSLSRFAADRKTVMLDLECKLTSFEGWQEIPSGGRQPVFATASTQSQELFNDKGTAVWIGNGPTRASLSFPRSHDGEPSPGDITLKRLLLLINAHQEEDAGATTK